MKLEFPDYRNPRGIPQAPFIDSVDDLCKDIEDASELVSELQQLFQKYQLMQAATTQRSRGLESKIPDLRKSLESVEFLMQQKSQFKTRYELNDTVYATAVVDPVDTVWLWLGANVMLEYPISEAETLLKTKLEDATSGLEKCTEDLEFLRENITTVEVNTARVINWRVTKSKHGIK
ncbi:tubulin-binding prefolding complex subunit [Starmerella bacillaris]|uniref:Prefoldin subunit 3 n=1 Tax=Starmerella bacillaris TaxID=1247836 RepID=A0AAV5RQE5_STABA|nr:tubulin-binding prefolding complex subunit [Starmerella bacillaris]